MHPFNPQIFTDVDFEPSRSFQPTTFVPDSFPDEVPTSPLGIPTDLEDETDTGNISNASEDTIAPANEFLVGDIESSDRSTNDDDENYITPVDCNAEPAEPASGSWHPSTCPSTRTSSLALPVDEAISRVSDPTLLSTLSHSPEMQMELRKILHQSKLLEVEVVSLKSELAASNAHCTVMKRAALDAQLKLTNTCKKRKSKVRVDAHFVTHIQLVEAHAAQKAEKAQKAAEEAKKQRQKTQDEANRLTRIMQGTVNKQFTGSLLSYKQKEDLIMLAGALELLTEGTVTELTLRIKAHLIAHPELASSDRFGGLFARCCHGVVM